MPSLQATMPATTSEISLPQIAPESTSPGMDTAGAALATALLRETKNTMNGQFAGFNFLNVSA